jgi:hypothetical protein
LTNPPHYNKTGPGRGVGPVDDLVMGVNDVQLKNSDKMAVQAV